MKLVNSYVDGILKLITLVTILVTAVGYIHLVWYYNQFNIQISQYVTISEVFIHSFGNVIFFLFGFIVPIGMIIYTYFSSDRKNNLEVIILFGVSILLYIGICVFQNLIDALAFKFITTSYMIMIVVFIAPVVFKDPFLKSNQIIKRILIFTISSMIIMGFVMLVFIFKENQNSIFKNGNMLKKIVLIKNDSKYIGLNDSLLFIGKTDNFYFLNDSVKKLSIIYPTSEIKAIMIVDGH